MREEHARAEQSRAQERTRIAREMHDTLSHRLALISTYAGALDYREDLDRDTVRSTARLVQQTAATASAELRTVLDILRDDPGDTRPEPDLRQLPELLAEFRAAGARIEMVGREVVDAEAVPDTAARTLYRILQEALTNAVKHAPGAPVTVRWSRRAGAVSLTVSNPQVADAHPEPNGFGLVGLDERARGLGGTISTERTETMFRLEACIPCRS
ncbi:MAG: histidine kinase [Kocuria palustris]|nr:histidine kinase [Kocuria palustris]